jgi:hypothetical protein
VPDQGTNGAQGASSFDSTEVEETDMDDDRVWSFEKSLWTGDADHYRELVDDECLMVLPTPPFVLSGAQAVEAVAATPRWSSIEITKGQISRPQEGLIIIAYHAKASRDDESYEANCTSTYRRMSHEVWRVVQHQQTPPLSIPAVND